MKKIKIMLSFLILMLCFSFLAPIGVVFAEETEKPKEKIYVSLGDSISKGYAINLKELLDSGETTTNNLITGEENDYSFIENCYAYKLNGYLKQYYGYNKGYNFAHNGDNCQDLINFISSFYDNVNEVCKNPNGMNSKFNTLTNLEVYNILSNAQTISVCIGANNILSEATDIITNYLGFQKNTTPMSYQQVEALLRDKVESDFEPQFQKLLLLINSLNSKAEVYFTTIYNPYAILQANEDLMNYLSSNDGYMLQQTLKASFGYDLQYFTQDRLTDIAYLSELAIQGGFDSTGKVFLGLNGVIKEEINKSKANDNSNFFMVDSYSKFNEKKGPNNEYHNYVNESLDSLTEQKLTNIMLNSNLENSIVMYMDPHPTYLGHNLIFETFKSNQIGTKYYQESNVNKTLVVILGISGFVLVLTLGSVIALKITKNRVC